MVLVAVVIVALGAAGYMALTERASPAPALAAAAPRNVVRQMLPVTQPDYTVAPPATRRPTAQSLHVVPRMAVTEAVTGFEKGPAHPCFLARIMYL